MALSSDSSGNPASLPFPALIADIGGTNARFGLMSDAMSAVASNFTIKTGDYCGIGETIADMDVKQAQAYPRTVILAVAGPVDGDLIPLTNCPWVIDPRRLIEDFGFENVIILNDFEAQALSLPSLSATDLKPIGRGTEKPQATKLVVGAGTGLGAATLVFGRDSWIPVAGEGGHIDFGPIHEQDFDIWRVMEKTNARLSAETFLSGPGIVRLYQALSTLADKPASFTKPAEITKAALDERDPIAHKALDLFCSYLGRYAGDMAIFSLARGGVYLAGGIAPQIALFLKNSSFRKAFEAKAPHDNLLCKIPTSIITHPNPALEGLAAYARSPKNFAINLSDRHWTA